MIKYPEMAFKDWFFQKMLEYEKEVDGRIDQKDFARYLKMGQSSVSQLLAGDYQPRGKNFDILYHRYGDEFLEVMGFKESEKPRDPLIATLEKLKEEDDLTTEELWDLIHRWLSDHGFIRTK